MEAGNEGALLLHFDDLETESNEEETDEGMKTHVHHVEAHRLQIVYPGIESEIKEMLLLPFGSGVDNLLRRSSTHVDFVWMSGQEGKVSFRRVLRG